MPKSRPPYLAEFRREAVGKVRSGRKVSEVAEALGVTEQSLRNWVKQDQLDRRERDDGLTSAEREELRALRERPPGSSRSATWSNEPRPSSPGRPISGEGLPDDRGGEGPGHAGLPRV